jgi:hypothetical protein
MDTMTAASDLIERLEAETGQRIDDDNSLAMAGLFGAMSRLLGQSPPAYRARDDVVAGLLIRHQMTPEYQRQKEADRLLAALLVSGVSPDDVKDICG